jgi:REP element-mobilizing transposase RayT
VPRPLREEIAGGIHHVWARGNNRQIIFVDDDDRRRYLRLLVEVVDEASWDCLAYCLMDNHVHLILQTPRTTLSKGMQLLHGRYAAGFNRLHAHIDHVFGGRFGSKPVTSDEQLWTLASYIALNPVKAGLCAAPGEYPWSSYGVTVGGRAPGWMRVARLLAFFAVNGSDGRAELARWVEACGAPAAELVRA